MPRAATNLIRASLLVVLCLAPAAPSMATSAIALRSRYRVVLAADSRAVYGAGRNATECKLFEVGSAYATVSGLAHYGSRYRAMDAVRDAYARPGTFQERVASAATSLQRRVEGLLAYLARNNPSQYRLLTQQGDSKSDIVAVAVAESVAGQPLLGIIELLRANTGDRLTAQTAICPGNCRQGDGLFYLGYWDRIRPYVANSGQPRSVGSAASIDRLIRLEINAHPNEVGAPINILELNGSGARWLQNGGNCSLPNVSW
jgi:hypothetical protein